MPTSLEVYNAFVEANQKFVQNKIDLMKAYADYNYRMLEAAKLQEEIYRMQLDTHAEQQRLKRIERAVKRFERALKQSQKNIRRVRREAIAYQSNANRITYFEQGADLSADRVSQAWTAVYFFTKQDGNLVRKINEIEITSQEKRGEFYSRNRYPDEVVKDAPASKRSAWSLLMWARKYPLLVPRNDTPASAFYQEVIDVFREGAEVAGKRLEAEQSKLTTELEKLRAKDWKQIDVEKEEPKQGE